MSGDLERRLQNLIRVGVVSEVQGDRARVDFGHGLVSEWLPWCVRRAHGDVEWWSVEVGEQVVVLSPGGLLEDGFIAWSLYQSDHPAPADSPDQHITRYGNGASMVHDRATGDLIFNLMGNFVVRSAAGMQVVAPSGVQMDTPNVSTSGGVTSQGTIESKTDVVFAGTSGKAHDHTEHDGYITSAPNR